MASSSAASRETDVGGIPQAAAFEHDQAGPAENNEICQMSVARFRTGLKTVCSGVIPRVLARR